MINFVEGKITLGAMNIRAASSREELNTLAEEGLIEKREDGRGTHYYVEAAAESIRLAVFIWLREKKIDSLILRWLDSPMKGWDDVSEEALRDEYRMLLDLVKRGGAGRPNRKTTGKRTWRFKWGQLEVSSESSSFNVAIYMKPK